MFSLESPQRGDFNEYTQYTISQYKKEDHPKSYQICNYRICSKGPKNEFKTAVVNEPSVFEPLKFYCNSMYAINTQHLLYLCSEVSIRSKNRNLTIDSLSTFF